MLGVITGFDEWLRSDMTMGRPVCEADGEQIRLALKQSQFSAKDQLVRLEAFEDGDLGPFG